MCTSPFYKRVDNIMGCRFLCLPCGKCEECLRQRQSDYMVRIVEELKHASKACFVTLTYRPETVPTVIDTDSGEVFHSVCKNHVVNWLKRFRSWYKREYGLDSPLRYFLTSEYGPETLRQQSPLSSCCYQS